MIHKGDILKKINSASALRGSMVFVKVNLFALAIANIGATIKATAAGLRAFECFRNPNVFLKMSEEEGNEDNDVKGRYYGA